MDATTNAILVGESRCPAAGDREQAAIDRRLVFIYQKRVKLRPFPFRFFLAAMLAAGFLFLGCTRHAKIETTQSLVEWNEKTLSGAYEKAGHTNASWDASAKRALDGFAKMRGNQLAYIVAKEVIETNVVAALNAGCDDPMIHYLNVRFVADSANPQALADAYVKVAGEINQSSYPPVRKFYSAYWALETLLDVYKKDLNNHPEVSAMTSQMESSLDQVLADEATPAKEAFDVADSILSVADRLRGYYDVTFNRIERPLTTHWPAAPTTWLLVGKAKINLAWEARGGGYANTVKPEAWKIFGERLEEARSALTRSWKMNPKDDRPGTEMIRVCVGLSLDEAEMNQWFNRAMNANPDCYAACQNKMRYLYPQWFGSREQMVEFGKECVANTNWGGLIPLVLADAHYEYWEYLPDSPERTGYWRRPDVWRDIQASFNRFFEVNPDDEEHYKKYAWYAYYAWDWDKLNELIPKLDSKDYDYFGGKENYDQIIREAKAHAKKTK